MIDESDAKIIKLLQTMTTGALANLISLAEEEFEKRMQDEDDYLMGRKPRHTKELP